MRKGLIVCAAATLLVGCTNALADGQKRAWSGSSALPSHSTQPTVDHHLHAMSATITTLVDGEPPLPETAVPAEFQRLLESRAASAKDTAALSRLFAADAVLLSSVGRRGWIVGGPAAAEHLVILFGRPYRLLPVHFTRTERTAQIAGYYVRGEGEALQYVGYFTLALRREADGRWAIVSEMPRFPVQPPKAPTPVDDLIASMDRNGIRRAALLSTAFWADGPVLPVTDPYPKVKAENDWTAQQAARFPDRFIAFCSFNPVADHALAELERCAQNPTFRGLKFSFAMSAVDLKDADHRERVRRVFVAANRHRLAIVAHTRGGNDYTAEHVEIFLNQIMPAAPDIPVQIAHFWGGEQYSESALRAFAEAVASGLPQTRNLYFDIAEVWAEISQTGSPEVQDVLVQRIRQIGPRRILFGSDGRVEARHAWRLFQGTVPLTPEELRVIATNVAPYARQTR